MGKNKFENLFDRRDIIKISADPMRVRQTHLLPKDILHRLAVITVFRDSNKLFNLNGNKENSEFIICPSLGGVYRAAKDGVCVTCRSLMESILCTTVDSSKIDSYFKENEIKVILEKLSNQFLSHHDSKDMKFLYPNDPSDSKNIVIKTKLCIFPHLRAINFDNYLSDKRMISLIKILNMANKTVAHSSETNLDHEVNNGYDLIWGPDILAELIAKLIDRDLSSEIFDQENKSFPKISLWGNYAQENRKFRVNWIEPNR